MTRELSLKELYAELMHSPDLRRLGRYKLIADAGQTVFPIDVDFEGKKVHLGDGDFTEGLVAFSNTRAASLDLGTSKFYDLYLDYLEAEQLIFSRAQASRVYFDYARVGDCQFKDFVATEVYFDEAVIAHISRERLRSGIIYLEHLQSLGFDPNDMSANAYRLVEAEKLFDVVNEAHANSPEEATPEVRLISTREFLQFIDEDLDLRRLGLYKVVPEHDTEDARLLRIGLELDGCAANLGQGDFTELKVQLAATRARIVDFADSKFDVLDFVDSEIENCFLADSEISELGFGNAKITNVFGERCRTGAVNLASLECRQFNTNGMRIPELRLAEARIRELYLSRGDGVENMYFENAELGLLNLHEGQVNEVHFGDAVVGRALINKASVKELNIEHLKADELYIGDFRNEIGRLRFNEGIEGIRSINIDEAFYAARRVLGEVEGYASRWPREMTADTAEQSDEIAKDSRDPELQQKPDSRERDVWLEGPRHSEKHI